jgi:hypothetical protein
MNNLLSPKGIFDIQSESLQFFKEFCERYETELLDGYTKVNTNRCKSFVDFCCMAFNKRIFNVMLKNNDASPSVYTLDINSHIDGVLDYYGSNDNSGFNK